MTLETGFYITCGVLFFCILTALRWTLIYEYRLKAFDKIDVIEFKKYPSYVEMAVDLKKWKYEQFFGG